MKNAKKFLIPLLPLLLVTATASCKMLASQPDEESDWNGLPRAHTCSWFETGSANIRHGTCVSQGRAYTCIWDRSEDRVECARTTQPMLPIKAEDDE